MTMEKKKFPMFVLIHAGHFLPKKLPLFHFVSSTNKDGTFGAVPPPYVYLCMNVIGEVLKGFKQLAEAELPIITDHWLDQDAAQHVDQHQRQLLQKRQWLWQSSVSGDSDRLI